MFKIIKEVKHPVDSKFLDFCQKYLKDGNRILEVGPGNGEFADRLLKVFPGLQYEFSDIKNSLTYQTQRPIQIADVSQARLNQPDGTMDVVITSQVVEHLHNLSHFILEAYRVLKPDGFLLIKMPNFDNFFQKVQFFVTGYPVRLSGTIDDGGHVNFVPHKYLAHFVERYFALLEKRGDIFLDPLFSRRIFRLFKKDVYLVSEHISSIYFSWNVMLCFKKKGNA